MTVFDLLPPPIFYRALSDRAVLGAVTTQRGLDRLLSNTSKWQLYCQLNPGGRTAETVTSWRAVLIDLDQIGESLDDFLTHLASFFPCPIDPDIIDSGRGMQLWLRFEPQGVAERKRIESATGAFLRSLRVRTTETGFVVDLSTRDLARCARMPGSVNQKTGRKSRILHAGIQHGASVPAAILSMVGPERMDVANCRAGCWQEAWPHLTPSAKWYLEHGAENGDRHRLSWHTAACLAESGIPMGQAMRLVWDANTRCPEPLDEEQLERQVMSAYRQKGTNGNHPQGRGKQG